MAMLRALTLLAATLCGLQLLLAAAAPPVRAHAVLVEAVPADGARLARPPDELRLRFNEPVGIVDLRLIDGRGAAVEAVDVEGEGERIVLRPARPLATGTYLLSYRVVSADGHPIGASLRFGIGAAVEPRGDASHDEARDAAFALLATLARWGVLTAALGAGGAALFVAATRPPAMLAQRCGRLGRGLALAGLAAAAARLGLAGVNLAGGVPADLLYPGPWRLALDTSLGPAMAMAAFGFLLLVVLKPGQAGWRALAALLVLGSFTLTGHAATAAPRWLAAPALGLHVLCAAWWAGSLLPLALALRLPRDEAVVIVHRFSRVAALAVAALLAAGTTLTVIQLGGRWAALWETTWGLRLSLKLALVAVLLAIAALNRLALTPALAAGRPLGRRLRATVLLDLMLAMVVLGVTATFPLSPPPRALLTEPASVATLRGADGTTATVVLLPGLAGDNQLEATVLRGDGTPFAGQRATLRLALPTAGIEPVSLTLTAVAPGLYLLPGVAFPIAGSWSLRLDLLFDDFTKVILEGAIDVR